MKEKIWNKALNTIIAAGQMPIPATATAIELLQTIMTEEQAKFITVFTRSLTIEELEEKTGRTKHELMEILNELMQAGVVSGIASRSTGLSIYRLLPLFPGIFEFTLMRGGTTERDKKLAHCFDKLFGEISDLVQSNYDNVVEAMKYLPAADRIIPVESQVQLSGEIILPADEVKKIIDKFDTIAVATCFCRHEKDLLGEACKLTDKRENCLIFGPSAEFTIEQKFARQISGEEALKILRESEDAGLIHKSFHAKLDPDKDQEAICACCKCCCATFQLFHKGARAMHSVTSFLAEIDRDACTGCYACVDMCPMDAIHLNDVTAEVENERCLGCGICAHHCTYNAARLVNTGKREVFVSPPRMKNKKKVHA